MLFKKNPPAMPELISFVFFAEPIQSDPDSITNYMNQLLGTLGMFEGSKMVSLDHQVDQFAFMIGDNFGGIFQRMPGEFPIDKLDPEDPLLDRVKQSNEHWALLSFTEDHPLKRLNDLIKLSLVMQAVSMAHHARALMFSPMGLLYRKSQWGRVVQDLIKNNTTPIRHWVGVDTREEGKLVDAASAYMDELFGVPNTEILNSARSPDETADILECAIIDSILNGPIHKRGKSWTTTTGVRYRVRFTKSAYDPARKATQLIEI